MTWTTHTPTPWPVIWSRNLRSHKAVARSNALAALRALQERRLEREEVERFFADQRDRQRIG